MRALDLTSFTAQPFFQFDKNWFLVTAGDFKKKWNTMTISWGFMGTMWGKPVVVIVIRPSRYTREFLDAQTDFTLSAFPKSYQNALTILGTKSGRDGNKVKEANLTPISAPTIKAPTFAEANITLECRSLYRQPMQKDCFLDEEPFKKWYSDPNDLHITYIAEVLGVWEKE